MHHKYVGCTLKLHYIWRKVPEIIKHLGDFSFTTFTCRPPQKTSRHKKTLLLTQTGLMKGGVVPPGIEPGTQGFSVLCSTN